MKSVYLKRHNLWRPFSLMQYPTASFAFWDMKGQSKPWKDYKKTMSRMSKDNDDPDNAEYEREI